MKVIKVKRSEQRKGLVFSFFPFSFIYHFFANFFILSPLNYLLLCFLLYSISVRLHSFVFDFRHDTLPVIHNALQYFQCSGSFNGKNRKIGKKTLIIPITHTHIVTFIASLYFGSDSQKTRIRISLTNSFSVR